MRYIVCLLTALSFFLLPGMANAQDGTHSDSVRRSDLCRSDTSITNAMIGRSLKLDEGGVFSTLNQSDSRKWPSKEIKKKAGKSDWKKKFKPVTGDVGTVVFLFEKKSAEENQIYLLKVRDFYVPVACTHLSE